MAINERLVHTASAAAGGGAVDAEQGLILHLDANDVDSYDGDGSIWYDISEHDVTIPLSDNADDLELHLNASDATSYDPTTGTTTWNDISGNARNATLTSMGNSSFDIDNGGFFDVVSTSDYVTIPYNAALVPTSTGYTFEGWYNFDIQVGGTNWSSIFGNWDESGAADGFLIRFKAANIELFIYENGNSLFASASNSTSISTNEWFHVAFTLSTNASGGLVKVYVNGELKINGSLSGTYNPNSSQDLFMCYGGDIDIPTSRYFDGKVGAGRIYSKALSASEVGQNYRHGRDYIYTDLAGSPSVHLDPASYSGSGTNWTADAGNDATVVASRYDEELGDSFDISTDGESTIVIPSGHPLNGTFTLEFWFKFQSTPVSLNRFIRESSETALQFFYLQGQGWRFYQASGADSSYYGNGSIEVGKWQHKVITFTSAGSFRAYIDGALIDTNDYNTSWTRPSTSLGAFDFGTTDITADKPKCDIGQIRMYSSALSQEQIRQNYNFTKPKYPNEFHGDIIGTPSWNTEGSFNISGGNYINLGSDEAINFTTNSSISVWVNSSNSSGSKGILGRFNNTSPYGYVLYQNGGNVGFSLYDSSGNGSFTATTTLTNSTWTHFVVTYDGSNLILYKNGTSVSNVASTRIPSTPSANTLIGRYYSNVNVTTYDFAGKISKVKFYNTALTQAEITALNLEGE